MHKFIENIIAFALRNYILVLFMTGILFIAGIVCYINTPIEAYPDVTNTRVRIITQWPGRSAEEVEKFVSLPIMREMNTIPKKADVRSVSLFGLSVVTVNFEDGVADFYAQQYAANRMNGINLPQGADSEIEPPSGATGEIFRYYVKSKLPIRDISSINKWVIEKELIGVPGVADINTFGGEEKIYEIRVNPAELANYDLSPLEVYEAVSKSNINVGGDMIQKGNQAFVVRGIGLLQSISDIENILIKDKGKTPIRVKDVASVNVASKPRLGQAGLNNQDDIVEGTVIMLRGQNPSAVIKNVKEKIKDLNNRILPSNVKVVPFIDRTTLVNTTIHTVVHNMAEGIILVSLVVFIFLYDWRSTIIVASVIPLSFLFAVIMLKIQGLPANLISMGALDFGLLLEGTLIIVEIIFVALGKRSQQIGLRYRNSLKGGLIKKSAGSVASNIFFALVILIVALFPIFSFQKVEGKMFSPLAFTLGYALLGSLIFSLTYVPVMCRVLFKNPVKERNNIISRFFKENVYKLYNFSSKYRKGTILFFCVFVMICLARFTFWGTEFIPKMNEGAIYIRATLPNSVNLDEAVKITKEMKHKLLQFNEVQFVLSQTGRPNDGTDPTGFFNIEFHAQLKPENQWKGKISKDQIINQMNDSLNIYPGIILGFSQPIEDNVEEYVAGVKSSLAVKIYGDSLEYLENAAAKTADVLKTVNGIEDVNVFKSIGLPQLNIRLDESKMARYGVSMADAQAVIEMSIGGKAATQFYERERIYDVQVRFPKEYRDNEDKIGNILIPTMDNGHIPLKEIADISFKTGPTFIYREGSSRYIGIGFSVRGRDMGSAIKEAQKKVDKVVKLNPENKMTWNGDFESQQRATAQLELIVPIVILLILFLLYLNFGTVKDTLIAASTIPYAFVGGFISLWATGTVFGISAGIGFIILFGITATNAILLIDLMKKKMQQLHNLHKAINEAVKERVRPMLMIAFMGSMGLLPASLSKGMGSEIQKPLAIMIVGGIIICVLLSFTVLPQVFYFAYRRDKRLQKTLDAHSEN